jgi:CubicO group peptidase (beta-lactamase class C family)
MRTLLSRPSCVLVAILILSSVVSLAAARSTSSQPIVGDSFPTRLQIVIDPAEFEAFVDGFMKDAMADYRIPGVTFAAVKDGEIYLLKGYGFANLEEQVPVDPEMHLFRVASISKLFVATAIMQLYERGQIDLNDDVNKYLRDFQIPDDGLGPISFADLLAHSSGLEGAIENRTDQASAYVSLETYISRHHPRRNAPAGETIEYSNLGYDLMGYLVQEISGQPFAEYVEQNLFRPLTMDRSTFEQVLPDRLAGDVAQRYQFANGAFSPLGLMYINETPAGGLYSTAQDMAAFMIAHLQDGNYQDAQILSPADSQLLLIRSIDMPATTGAADIAIWVP